ncbi:hypothetical protein TIFTF001_040603 [Ficus carica]|uniref:Protein kinase domain-containing protein n=1 Tax=Ficus carica TaxID=3494 RepID=A0AA87YWL1_FICCA|nr:hypothetical protein TIFTF001_040594 [Ficus carica]GMN24708.1 hypothetical protein TIFTF001_040603 [Ficus carica]
MVLQTTEGSDEGAIWTNLQRDPKRHGRGLHCRHKEDLRRVRTIGEDLHQRSEDNKSIDTPETSEKDFTAGRAVQDSARLGLLHEDTEQCVLHRDIKSANVLLDTDFSTKFGDVEDSDDGVGGDFWLLGAG